MRSNCSDGEIPKVFVSNFEFRQKFFKGLNNSVSRFPVSFRKSDAVSITRFTTLLEVF